MRNSGVYSIETGPGIRPKELDGFTCPHCQFVTLVKPFCDPVDAGGYCMCCAKPICKNCIGKDCTPFLKSIEKQEAKAAAVRGWF